MATILGTMLAATLLQFLLRRVLQLSFDFVDRSAGAGLLWLVMLGAAAGAAHGSHLAIDALPVLLAGRRRAALAVATTAVTLVVAAGLAFVSARFAIAEVGFSGLFGGLSALAMPVGFGLIAVHAAGALLALRGGARGEGHR